MKTSTFDIVSKAEKEIATLIVRDNYRGVQSTDGKSVTYTEKELNIMMRKFAILK